jgi:hypothetical protein
MATDLAIDAAEQISNELPFSLILELTVDDPDTVAELCRHMEGEEREQFALKALRIGVLALRQARGQIDGEVVRRESERLLAAMQSRLGEHSNCVQDRLSGLLRDYFDPSSGRFQERCDRLVRKDGDLEQLLRRQIGNADSELCRTLTSHFGEESPLMKMLSPDQSQGLLATLRQTLDEQLTQQREHVLRQFSLDAKDSAMSRFIAELTGQQGRFSEQLHERIDKAVNQFSLDDENSALSRLVRNVREAQKTITNEFSLDSDSSALSRLKRMLEQTNGAIHSHLSLDDENSALARLKRELTGILDKQGETNNKFQEEVKVTLQSMAARRAEADRSTRHGLDFEQALFQLVQLESQRSGDLATWTGNTTGLQKNCKIGDAVVELGPDSAAPGAKIVVEAKEKIAYQMVAARDELDTARKNREAQVGLFVFSKKSAPTGIEPLTRYGCDIFIVWDSDDPTSDLFLRTGLTLARALCVRTQQARATQAADFASIDAAIVDIERRLKDFEELKVWTSTIQNNSEKILKKLETVRKAIEKQTEVLRDSLAEVKITIAPAGSSSETEAAS